MGKIKTLSKFSEITSINAFSKSFDFLADEPDIYSLEDIICDTIKE